MPTQETVQWARKHLSSDSWYTEEDITYASAMLDTFCQGNASRHTDADMDLHELVISLTAATGAVAAALHSYRDALSGRLSPSQYKDAITSIAHATSTTGATSKQILMELHRKFGVILDENLSSVTRRDL